MTDPTSSPTEKADRVKEIAVKLTPICCCSGPSARPTLPMYKPNKMFPHREEIVLTTTPGLRFDVCLIAVMLFFFAEDDVIVERSLRENT